MIACKTQHYCLTIMNMKTTPPSKTSHTSLIFLLVLKIILGVIAVFLIGCGIWLLVPNQASASFFEDIVKTGQDINNQTFLAFTCFSMAIIVTGYFFVVSLLRKIVKTVLEGEPFSEDNIARLRRIWIIIAATEIMRMVISLLANGGEVALIEIRLGAWFLVFVIATLSEAFRHGVELRRDQEFTI